MFDRYARPLAPRTALAATIVAGIGVVVGGLAAVPALATGIRVSVASVQNFDPFAPTRTSAVDPTPIQVSADPVATTPAGVVPATVNGDGSGASAPATAGSVSPVLNSPIRPSMRDPFRSPPRSAFVP